MENAVNVVSREKRLNRFSGGRALRSLCIALTIFGMLSALRGPGQALASGGTVYAHFHACADDYHSGLGHDRVWLDDTCEEPFWYGDFDLTSEGQKYSEHEVSGDWGTRTFADVPAHIFSLGGDFSPYDAEPVVFCQNGSGTTDDGYELMTVGQS